MQENSRWVGEQTRERYAMSGLGAVCDDFYISCRLFLKLDMALERETVLHFFDRIRREYPGLSKLRRRDGGSMVLEEEPSEEGTRRWIRLDRASLRFGVFSPSGLDDFARFGQLILSQAPFHLTFSAIDYDHLELAYGFDLEYRGNHDQLVAETLLPDHPANAFLLGDHATHIIDAQPYFGITLNDECDLQAYVEVKSRSTTYEVRSGTFEGEPITVFLTIRKYWGEEQATDLAEMLNVLGGHAEELATERVVPYFVNPLAAAIASRS